MGAKKERYFSGSPGQRDPSQPLPGEISPQRRQLFTNLVAAVILIAIGLVIGIMVSPESPKELQGKIRELERDVESRDLKISELSRAAKIQPVTTPTLKGKLKPDDRKRHETMGKRYADTLRAVKAQQAGELIEWFVKRWNDLLDNPEPDDRVNRRAALLAQLVSGMAKDLHPDDFVPWQAEFLFNSKWLGDLQFDLDGDGFPRKRSGVNPKDGFAATSVCQIGMALNQSMTDAEVLITADLDCDKPENKMSVFLQGATLDEALNEYIRACKREGFVVVEKNKQGVRLVLVGKKV
jgi:hypothetical protein